MTHLHDHRMARGGAHIRLEDSKLVRQWRGMA